MDPISRLIAKNQLKTSQVLQKSVVDAKAKGLQAKDQSPSNPGRAQQSLGQVPLDDLKKLLRAEFHGTDWIRLSHPDARQNILKRAVRVLLKAELKLLETADPAYLDACLDDVYQTLCSDPSLMDEVFLQLSNL